MEVLSQIADVLQEAHDKIDGIESGDYTPRKNQILAILHRQVMIIRTNLNENPLGEAPEFPPLVLRKDMVASKETVVLDETPQDKAPEGELPQDGVPEDENSEGNKPQDETPEDEDSDISFKGSFPIAPAPEDPAPFQPKILTPLEEQAAELKATLEILYPIFCDTDSKAIKETYGDIEIKGVAKMAGMTVSEDEPKNVTIKFIDEVKKAIKKRAEIAALGNADKAQ